MRMFLMMIVAWLAVAALATIALAEPTDPATPARTQRDQAMNAWEQCMGTNIKLQVELEAAQAKIKELEAKLPKETPKP